MKNIFIDRQLIEEHSPKMGGVFRIEDLETIFNEPQKTEVYRRISRMEEYKILTRFVRGIYITKDLKVECLSQKICPDSYISFATILAENLIIGTLSKYRIDAIKLGKTRYYTNETITIKQYGCQKSLWFGFKIIDGVKKATPEKALLDTLYYYQHGTKFNFDIFSDLNVSRINFKRLKEYLNRYENPKFIRFVERIIDEATRS